MPRIPDEEIERLKREISLVALVEARGVQLTGSRHNLVGRCCLHDDKTPSLIVDGEKGVWHCFGACQTGGSVIDWIMKAEGVAFREAVAILQGKAPPPSDGVQQVERPVAKPPAPVATPTASLVENAELVSKVVEHYHSTLQQSDEAKAYLKARGIDHPEAIERFKLGFANRSLSQRMTATKRGGELRARLGELGILRASGHEHLAGSLVIPLFDGEGLVAQMYGRKILEGRPGTPKHLYLPGPHRGVFNREAFGESDVVILCEALIDALTFWCAGHRNVTAAYGVEGFTDEMADAFVSAGIQVVKIAFDRDEAGDRGAEKVSAKLKALGIETQRVQFPKGMDANEYARKVAPAEKSLGIVLERAEWMSREAPEELPSLVASPSAPPPANTNTDPVDEAMETSTVAEELEAKEEVEASEEIEEVEGDEDSEEPEELPSLVASPSASSAPVIQTSAAELRAARTSTTHAEETSPATSSRSAETHAPAASGPELAALQVEEQGDEVHYRIGDRVWQVKAAGKPRAGDDTRVHVRVTRTGGGLFIDVLELRAARQRAGFARAAAAELRMDEEEIANELVRLLLEMEKRRDEKAQASLASKGARAAELTACEREEALMLLRDPRLLERVLEDLHRVGIVGEETNKLVAYLATTSRKLKEPLAIVIQSSSAAGKSSLMDAVLSLVPEEERVQYSAMTGQSLFYMGGQNLKHKVLAIVEEEGAEQASYALKLLQSEGELTIASAGKDPATGKHATHEYRVEGPVMIFLTTTAIEVDEELLNRCIVLSVDEGAAQTAAIHERQREGQLLEGLEGRLAREEVRRLHRNAQRLLKPIAVVNPYARGLRFPTHTTRTRRDHMKYLTLIRSVALMHQYQREVKTIEHGGEVVPYIEATREDVEIATVLAHRVLGRSLDDLPPQTRRLLDLLLVMMRTRVVPEDRGERFTRREVREYTGWGQTQLRLHLERLAAHEYVMVYRLAGGPRQQEYELAYTGGREGGERHVDGLTYDWTSSGGHRGVIGALSGHYRGGADEEKSGKKALNGSSAANHENRRSGAVSNGKLAS